MGAFSIRWRPQYKEPVGVVAMAKRQLCLPFCLHSASNESSLEIVYSENKDCLLPPLGGFDVVSWRSPGDQLRSYPGVSDLFFISSPVGMADEGGG